MLSLTVTIKIPGGVLTLQLFCRASSIRKVKLQMEQTRQLESYNLPDSPEALTLVAKKVQSLLLQAERYSEQTKAMVNQMGLIRQMKVCRKKII